MKKLTLAVFAAVVIAGSSAALADSAPAPVESAAVESSAPAVSVTRPAQRQVRVRTYRRNSGVFSRLMELERRKNAWLVRTFLGR